MTIYKEKLAAAFTQASATYDQVATVQKQCAQKLVNDLLYHFPSFYPQSLLDVGTGTGEMVNLLAPHFPTTHYTLNDISAAMLQKAQDRLQRPVKIIHDDMERAEWGLYSCVTSNFAFQWAQDPFQTIKRFYESSEYLVFTCLLAGTFGEWAAHFKRHQLLSPVPAYPSLSSLNRFLQTLSPRAIYWDVKHFPLQFETPWLFAKYLKQLGAHITAPRICSNQLKRLFKAERNAFSVTYQVFFCILRRQ